MVGRHEEGTPQRPRRTVNTILTNAIVSIKLGVEDYRSEDRGRAISALRNISAGILLLFKEKLIRLAPNETLIKKDFQLVWADGKVSWSAKGDRTIDYQGIKDRFKLVGLGFDFRDTDAIVNQRNRIEHYVADLPIKTLRGTVATAVTVINRFCREHLGQEAAAIFGPETWEVLLAEQAINDAETKACRERMSRVKWPYPELETIITEHHTCRNCGSSLASPVDTDVPLAQLQFSCASCGAIESYTSAVEPAFVSWAAGENYRSIKDGGDAVSDDCDVCLSDMVLASSGYCVACGHEHYAKCAGCGQVFRKGHYCEYCDAMEGRAP
jgi:hypothetical protein